jgi:hypothetical protein
MKLDTKTASLDAVGAVRGLQKRVCALECGRGQRADGDQCVKITCDTGYVLGDSGTCERIKDRARSVALPPAQHSSERAEPPKRQAPGRASTTPAASTARAAAPQVACDRFGCQPVRKGCSVKTSIFKEETQQNVVCN